MTNSFEFAFLASFLGGLVAAGIVYLFDRFTSVPTTSLIDAPVIAYPHSSRLRAACYAIFCAWILLPLSVALLIVAAVTNFRFPHLAIWMLAAFCGFVVLYLALAITLKCSKCQERITIQWVSEPRHTERMWGMDGWASIVVRV